MATTHAVMRRPAPSARHLVIQHPDSMGAVLHVDGRMRSHLVAMVVLGMCTAGCPGADTDETDTDEALDTDETLDTADSSGGPDVEDTTGGLDEIECRDDGCFQTCVREFSPPGAAGELCTEPADEHEAWACDADLICNDLTLEGDATDLDGVRCILEALRDRTPGALRFRDGTDSFSTQLDVFIVDGGVALVDSEGPGLPSTCLTFQIASSVGGLELLAEDDPFWQGCLDATESEDVYGCLFGPISEDPAVVQEPLPWQSPTCASTEASCDD